MSELPSSKRAPKGTFIGRNIDVSQKLDDLQTAAWHNALRLIDDAINMYKLQSYPTACFLAITAMEECAKVFGVGIVKVNTDYYQREGQELDKVVDEWLEDHAVKLKEAAFMAVYSQGDKAIGSDEFRNWLKRTENGDLVDLRTRSLYSGEWKKRIMEPSEQIKEEDAFREICMAIELASVALDNYYILPNSGKIRDSKAHLEIIREKGRLRRKIEDFKRIRHVTRDKDDN